MNIVFIGCGPSNLFSVLYLIENGFDGSQITIIDKGKDPYERTDRDLLYGLGGAGFWSDGKYIFADYYYIVSEKNKIKYFNFIKDTLSIAHLQNPINISKPKDFELKQTSLQLKQAECWHLGSINNIMLGKQLYDYLLRKEVNFYWGEEILDINFDKKQIITNKGICDYNFLQIGLGQKSNSFITNLCNRYDIKIKSGAVHIGGRFETKLNEKIEELSKIQYDFKLTKRYTPAIELRTFCVNSGSAYVVEEKFNNRIQYNGHSYGDTSKYNGLINFGIIAEIKSDYSYSLQQRLLNEINGNYVYLKQNPSFKSSLNFEEKTVLTQLPFLDKELNSYFYDFILEINKLFDLKEDYLFYLPEAKLSPGIIDLDENFNLKDGRYKEVNWVGDSCTGTRGIVPASLTGLKAVEKFLK
jgi:uncharacterized FAD-dependent dehydrogenase